MTKAELITEEVESILKNSKKLYKKEKAPDLCESSGIEKLPSRMVFYKQR
jgi:hypothetical protein